MSVCYVVTDASFSVFNCGSICIYIVLLFVFILFWYLCLTCACIYLIIWFCVLVASGVKVADPGWFQQLVGQLDDDQKKDLEEIYRLADQKRAAAGWFHCHRLSHSSICHPLIPHSAHHLAIKICIILWQELLGNVQIHSR